MARDQTPGPVGDRGLGRSHLQYRLTDRVKGLVSRLVRKLTRADAPYISFCRSPSALHMLEGVSETKHGRTFLQCTVSFIMVLTSRPYPQTVPSVNACSTVTITAARNRAKQSSIIRQVQPILDSEACARSNRTPDRI